MNGESEWHEESGVECLYEDGKKLECLDEDFFREEVENFANKSVLGKNEEN